ncbi:FecCD family ABC transporter permease [Rubellimicrobium roseum]|uniref:Iron ABC transporter permease n=1 Tax=Rubellimicrobium roseum TaxID=687525 RepID=A0A5C4N5C9_9RHOB|nr:iron ABC transporter permease [Rubellimicrobium roseum]TNC61814.1 iron ABC transporter permease [Rubellimicrobium roseum]
MTRSVMVELVGGRLSLALLVWPLAVLVLLACALLLTGAFSLLTGSYGLSAPDVLAVLRGTLPEAVAGTVVWEFRFPRLLVAMLAGALLALSGAILQGVTRNPLADPSLVGVSQGASLAVVSLIILAPQADGALRPFAAFAGALAVAALIQAMSGARTTGATMRFVLTGIGMAAFISAVTSTLLTYGRIDGALSALGWLAGSVHAAGWNEVRALGLVGAMIVPAATWAARPLGALRMGPEVAVGLGLAVSPARVGLITLSVAAAAAAVAAVGPLGFVGLVAPHIARRVAHSGPGLHLALSAATGALMVTLADLIGRAAFVPLQIPAGLVTALMGAPLFVALMLRAQSRQNL